VDWRSVERQLAGREREVARARVARSELREAHLAAASRAAVETQVALRDQVAQQPGDQVTAARLKTQAVPLPVDQVTAVRTRGALARVGRVLGYSTSSC
jgi:hypothetical protein